MKALTARAGLGILNVLYVICVIAAGYVVLSVLYIAAAAVALAGLAGIIGLLIYIAAFPPIAFWFFLFGLVGACAFGVLMFIGLIYLGRLFNRGNMNFLRRNNQRISERGGKK